MKQMFVVGGDNDVAIIYRILKSAGKKKKEILCRLIGVCVVCADSSACQRAAQVDRPFTHFKPNGNYFAEDVLTL